MNVDNNLTNIENEVVEEAVKVNQVERKPYVKPSFVTFASIAALSLASCNSGTSSGNSPSPVPSPTPIPIPTPSPSPDPKPTPTPTPSPSPSPVISQLQEFINSLIYSPNAISTTNQSSFTINSHVDIESIQISFYKDSVNCSSGLNNVINLNGNVSLRPGTYTTSSYSNFYICQKFSEGCTGLLAAVEAATAWSMQYTYYFANGSSYQSSCMINPANPIGKSAEFFANYTTGLTACTAGNSCEFSQAYSLPLGWAKQVGAVGGQSFGYAIISEMNGNKYIAGYTTAALSGQIQTGLEDYFIAKYDSNGNLLWTKQVGVVSGTTIATGVGVDAAGNSYISGYTNAALSGQIQTGVRDYFIAKYDPDGNLLWTKQVGAVGGTTTSQGTTVDAAGNSYISGYTNAALSGQIQTGLQDYFIAKYDPDGNLLWTKQVGATGGTTAAYGVDVDAAGNNYISGYTTAALSGQIQTGVRDYFIAKYDPDGNLLWTKQAGTVGGTTSSQGITVDAFGNGYITGYTNAALSGQIQSGLQDYFIAKYDPDGNLLWTKQVGAAGGSSSGRNISIANGNSYLTGYTNVGLSGQSLIGLQDYFIAKYDPDGNLLWTKQVGAAGGSSQGLGISSDINNSYVSGTTDIGISGQSLTGVRDYFITKVPD